MQNARDKDTWADKVGRRRRLGDEVKEKKAIGKGEAARVPGSLAPTLAEDVLVLSSCTH